MTTKDDILLIKAIFGTIGSVLGLLVTFSAILKCYYSTKCHCKECPTNVHVVVEDVEDRKYAHVSWKDPKRNCFEKTFCKVKSYTINCGMQGCEDIKDIDFKVEDEFKIELIDKYKEHKLQVTVNYDGRVLSAEHSSKPSSLENDNCYISALPSEPVIIQINLYDKPISIDFQSPLQKNGTVDKYCLRYKTLGEKEEHAYIENYITKGDFLHAELDICLLPDAEYHFSLAAVALRNDEEKLGKWSVQENYIVPKIGVTDSTFSWSIDEWRVLQQTFMIPSVNDVSRLQSYLLGPKGNITACTPSDKMEEILINWKKTNGDKATIPSLMNILKKNQLMEVLECLQLEYKDHANKDA